jgi:hypothetical protein
MRRRHTLRWAALAIGIVIAGGCARDGASPSAGDDGVAAVAVSPSVSALAGPTSVAVSVVADSSAAPVAPTIVLAGDGLGVASFGDDADATVAAVTAVLGASELDSGWVEPMTIGACAGTEARFVAWGSLYAYFSDESAVSDGGRHFFGYSYGSEQDLEAIPEGLATPEGIGLGTTVEFLRAAYNDVVIEAGEEGLFAPSFFVDDRLSGRLTGADDDDLVTVIIGGDPCGVGM